MPVNVWSFYIRLFFVIPSPSWRNVSVHTQWVLKPQIDINIWSISWHEINRPDFDIVLMSNCKYHMDNNITMSWMCLENDRWQQIFGKNNIWLKKTFWLNFLCQCATSIWYQQLTSIWCWQLTLQKLPSVTYGGWSVDINCWHHFDVISTFFYPLYSLPSGEMSALCLVLIYFLP